MLAIATEQPLPVPEPAGSHKTLISRTSDPTARASVVTQPQAALHPDEASEALIIRSVLTPVEVCVGDPTLTAPSVPMTGARSTSPDIVDAWGEQSFPASDPPANW